MMHKDFQRGDYIKLILGVVAISFSPLAVKLVSFEPSISAFYRSFYASVFFFVISLWHYKGRFDVKHMRWFLPSAVAGVFLGIDLVLWHKTIFFLGAGPATFLGNSQILFVTLFAALVLREKIPSAFYGILVVVILGLFLLTPVQTGTLAPGYGYIMGLAVGFTYAGMLVSLRYAKKLSGESYPEFLSLFAVFGFSTITIAVYTLGAEQGNILVWDLRSHILMAATALFCQALGWYLINNNLTKIPAHDGSLMLLLQPLLATVWGSLLFAEGLSGLQISGIVLTLAGIVVYQTKYAPKILGSASGK